jgi:hypothetical protein
VLVACFSLDSESIDTTSANSRWISEHLKNPDLTTLPVAMMVENNEKEWLEKRMGYAGERFKSLNRHQLTGSDAPNWTPNNIPEIPFVPYFKHERRLPFPQGSRLGLAESFLGLAGSILPETELCLPDSSQNFFQKYVHENTSPYADEATSGNYRLPRPYHGNEPYAFLSYARDDQDEVLLLIQELAQLGFRIWWDEGIVAGSDWQSDLDAKISQCRHLLLFISARSTASPHVQREVAIATATGKTILAVRLDWTEVPPAYKKYLLRYQILDRRSSTFELDLGRAMFSLFA